MPIFCSTLLLPKVLAGLVLASFHHLGRNREWLKRRFAYLRTFCNLHQRSTQNTSGTTAILPLQPLTLVPCLGIKRPQIILVLSLRFQGIQIISRAHLYVTWTTIPNTILIQIFTDMAHKFYPPIASLNKFSNSRRSSRVFAIPICIDIVRTKQRQSVRHSEIPMPSFPPIDPRGPLQSPQEPRPIACSQETF